MPSQERRDLLVMLVVVAVYAVVAFVNLGSGSAPPELLYLHGGKQPGDHRPGQTQRLSGIMYYTGLYPGSYDLEYSVNGSNWMALKNPEPTEDENGELDSTPMPQSYADLFKWQYAKVSGEVFRTRFLRISARSLPMELGELALYDENGELIDVSGVDSVLLDEQDTVPESPSWFNSMYFDEIYHGRTAYEHIKNVEPYEITHPPLGKELIALGISLFGHESLRLSVHGHLLWGPDADPAVYFHQAAVWQDQGGPVRYRHLCL